VSRKGERQHLAPFDARSHLTPAASAQSYETPPPCSSGLRPDKWPALRPDIFVVGRSFPRMLRIYDQIGQDCSTLFSVVFGQPFVSLGNIAHRELTGASAGMYCVRPGKMANSAKALWEPSNRHHYARRAGRRILRDYALRPAWTSVKTAKTAVL